jgi:hypothetical protein
MRTAGRKEVDPVKPLAHLGLLPSKSCLRGSPILQAAQLDQQVNTDSFECVVSIVGLSIRLSLSSACLLLSSLWE